MTMAHAPHRDTGRFFDQAADRTNYEVYKKLERGFCFVRRKADGETFVGHPFDLTRRPAMQSLLELFRRGAGPAAEQVMNHENLLAPQGYVRNFPVDGSGAGWNQVEDVMLWDWCDAGTLSQFLTKPPLKISHDAGYLPESLVWHVAISVLRALQYLHEGIRDTYEGHYDVAYDDPRKCTPIRGAKATERDWLPVLHCEVTPENIFLSHPRGIETYGLVRLGNYGSCHVCPKVLENKNELSPLVCLRGFNASANDIKWVREQFKAVSDPQNMPVDGPTTGGRFGALYTHADELASLGAILYKMMLGRDLPPFGMGRCSCQCLHVRLEAFGLDKISTKSSSHQCYQTVWPWEELARCSAYTQGLKETVFALIRLGARVGTIPGTRTADAMANNGHDAVGAAAEKPVDSWENRASLLLDNAWTRHMAWREGTPDGRGFLDIFDDKLWRQNSYRDTVAKKMRLASETLALDLDALQERRAPTAPPAFVDEEGPQGHEDRLQRLVDYEADRDLELLGSEQKKRDAAETAVEATAAEQAAETTQAVEAAVAGVGKDQGQGQATAAHAQVQSEPRGAQKRAALKRPRSARSKRLKTVTYAE